MKPVGKGEAMKKILNLALVAMLTLAPTTVLAESLNGSLYVAQGASVPVAFAFSVSGETFIAIILTFGMEGNGRWFAAVGTTDGVSGTGQIIFPTGFAITEPPGSSMQFQLDQPDAPAGIFAITGLEDFLSITSGRFVRIFP